LLKGKPYILKTQKDKKGYERASITINRVKHTYKLHRVVAMTFIPNPDKLPQVNHIDGDKRNNAPENLMVFPSQSEHAKWHAAHDPNFGKRGGDSE
jgi:hypothetical protein